MSDFLKHWRARTGRESFEEFLAPHVEHLYRLAFRFTRNAPAAEDLVQDVLVKVYRRQDEVLKLDLPRPWLARVLYHEYVDRWRREKLAPINLSELDPEEEQITVAQSEAEDQHDPEHAAMGSELRERLTRALALLNEDQRAVILFHDVEGYTLEELTVVLGQPLGTLKSRIHRGRAKLRELLEATDGTIAASGAFSIPG